MTEANSFTKVRLIQADTLAITEQGSLSCNMSRSAQRAPFIVIEGLDRSGKTTQTRILHTRLQDAGVDVKLIKFPGTYIQSECLESFFFPFKN